jgi:hypothetical protein
VDVRGYYYVIYSPSRPLAHISSRHACEISRAVGCSRSASLPAAACCCSAPAASITISLAEIIGYIIIITVVVASKLQLPAYVCNRAGCHESGRRRCGCTPLHCSNATHDPLMPWPPNIINYMLECWCGTTSWDTARIIAYSWLVATSNASPVVLHVSLRCCTTKRVKFLPRPPNRLI